MCLDGERKQLGGFAKKNQKLKGDTFDFHFIDGARKSNGLGPIIFEDILANLAVLYFLINASIFIFIYQLILQKVAMVCLKKKREQLI
jgi:hypothetical protein